MLKRLPNEEKSKWDLGTYKLKTLEGTFLKPSYHGNRLRLYSLPHNTEYRLPSYKASMNLITWDLGIYPQKGRQFDGNNNDTYMHQVDQSTTSNELDDTPTSEIDNIQHSPRINKIQKQKLRTNNNAIKNKQPQNSKDQQKKQVQLQEVKPYIQLPVRRIYYQ
ncbi:hypothetical protein BDA99DRAFT_544642 [Phascolomyces articulosus]|uniref:Uncharacterized protein n=1 Tax=Phascolomyces articulosus TaxID=60185 RepID=A0AAD5JKX3_9FUNG|nr:hypothetical protein BDA99DRAFT_544642 [Phascolomyces articulosus]